MNKRIYFVAALVILGGASISLWKTSNTVDNANQLAFSEPAQKYPKPPGKRPSDWFYVQRSFPYDTISQAKRQASLKFAVAENLKLAANSKLRRSASAPPVWVPAGPTNIPGRIVDVEAVAGNISTVYAGSAAGGVFKSTDSGNSWTQIFDNYGSYSVGDIAIDPNNSSVIYVGTGESNPAFDTYEGDGIYKSTDGGTTFTNMGLPDSRRIARIVVDPTNSDRIFVAVGGQHFGGGNGAGGLYRSDDGGANWTNKLFVSDTTGCIDVVLFPATGVVIAAMWERVRLVDEPSRLGGITTGIYRSSDLGETWTLLTSLDGLLDPSDLNGRIGLTAVSSGTTAYALLATSSGAYDGFYKSIDQGLTWSRTIDNDLVNAPLNASWGGGWYFGQTRVAQSDPSIVFALGFDIYRTATSGDSWDWRSASIHVDQHALWIDPANPQVMYSGCDGGVNFSSDGGLTWAVRIGQPSTQFYAITIDPTNPERLYGGTQDNGTLRTLTGATGDWTRIWGGDGFYVIVDPTDPDIIYAESQNGWLVKTFNGGASWTAARNGMNFNGERHAWSTPIAMDPNDNLTLYYGSEGLYKTTDGAANWTAISADLSDAPHPRSSFGVITTISPAKTDNQVVYVGTDDGNVWVTQNGGGSWTQIDAAIPDRWITRVATDPRQANIAYVTVSGYLSGSSLPHIFRTEDFGATWTDISGNFPDAPINDIIPSPFDSLALIIGTDIGVYETADLGTTWAPLGTGLPILPVHDIDFHPATGKLVAGTHGRSMYSTTIDVPPTSCCVVAGDYDNNGSFNIADVTAGIARIFNSGSAPICQDEADANGDNSFNVADVTYGIARIFNSGPAPVCGTTGI